MTPEQLELIVKMIRCKGSVTHERSVLWFEDGHHLDLVELFRPHLCSRCIGFGLNPNDAIEGDTHCHECGGKGY
jgi:DnaJ-class molecular chaperone